MLRELRSRVEQLSYRVGITPTMGWLLFINLAVFIAGRLIGGFSTMLGLPPRWLFNLLAVPAWLPQLILEPWTLVTYMFYHVDFTHIFWNLMWFWAFARLFLMRRTSRQLRNLYILGGLAGGLLYILAYNLFPYFAGVLPAARALGASAAVMAITIAAAYDDPDREVYLYGLLAVRVKWIALAAVAIDVMSVTGSNAGGSIAHIGGAIIGFLYIHMLRRGTDLGAWLNHLLDWGKARPQRQGQRPRFRRYRGNQQHASSSGDSTRQQGTGGQYRRYTPPQDGPGASADRATSQAEKEAEEREIQRIIEKLKQGGYPALTSEEKEKLFRK
ncbi:MAG: hypothetical protein CSA07_00970 [Bacteroidia bacterium]|nr:MAG: hypothetical protein CSA07_00970 [Bacteroidia bacterium]